MKIVLHIPTNRLVYRELPEPPNQILLINALIHTELPKAELVVVEIAESEWLRELALRQAERPVPQEERLTDLERRVKELETGIH